MVSATERFFLKLDIHAVWPTTCTAMLSVVAAVTAATEQERAKKPGDQQ